MMPWLHREPPCLALRRQVGVEIFRQRASFGLEETVQENCHEFLGPSKENLIGEGVVSREQGFEEMHMRVLPARHGGRNALFVAALGMSKVLADIIDQLQRLRAQALGPDHPCSGGKGEQDEGVIVEVARPVDRPVVEIEAPGKAAFRKTSGPLEERESEHHGFACVRNAVARGL